MATFIRKVNSANSVCDVITFVAYCEFKWNEGNSFVTINTARLAFKYK